MTFRFAFAEDYLKALSIALLYGFDNAVLPIDEGGFYLHIFEQADAYEFAGLLEERDVLYHESCQRSV